MAAVLCNALGDLFKGVCTGIEKVICLPCKACGIACENIFDIVASPFFAYMAVTLGCNIPAIAYAFKSMASGGGGEYCSSSLRWQLVNAALCVIHIIAALYIIKLMQADRQDTLLSGGNYDQERAVGGENSLKRVQHVLCYDKGIAMYIVVLIVYLIWQSVGTGKFLSGSSGCEGHYFVNILTCNYVFISLGAMAFACSICCVTSASVMGGGQRGSAPLSQPVVGSSTGTSKYGAATAPTKPVAVATATAVAVPVGGDGYKPQL